MTERILHLFNCHKWYDMIERDEKLDEYREIAVWKKRICRYGNAKHINQNNSCSAQCPFFTPKCREAVPTDITHVCFHRGYASRTMLREVEKITVGRGKPEWGAPDHDTFIIKLKERAK